MRFIVEPAIIKSRQLPVQFEYRDLFFDLRKSKVKAHYRRLPNGKTVYIQQYMNKKTKKGEVLAPHRLVHADENSTTTTNYKGEPTTYKHEPYNEMNQDDIHGFLNSAMTIDDSLGFKMWMHQKGIRDIDKFLNDLIADERDAAKAEDREPEFNNKKDALNWVKSSKAGKKGNGFKGSGEYTKELKEKYGHVTTYAKAMMHPRHRDITAYMADLATDENAPAHESAEARMMMEHSQSAQEAAEKEMEQIKQAQKLKPEDCPQIHGMSAKTEYFGHQAETLAKLNVLQKAIVDVDMGGGKGLILPADAANLMGQGKVKRPLIVVPAATLEQNALKIHDYSEGGMNVFNISNDTINEKYDGDAEKMVEDIRKAPPNTIFMASYDVFSYKDKDSDDELSRARALSAAGFDYVALDEAHNIKNIETTRFKSMKFLTQAKYKRVASGTFLSNNPGDALGQLLFLYPQMSMTLKDFQGRYGMKETPEGVQWTGLKDLRKDLSEMGMISLRRSAWIDKLPKREENLSVVKMEPRLAAAYNAVLDDVIDQLEEEMKKNPRLKKFFDDDGLGDYDEAELPPQALAKLMLVGGIVDAPHEMAEMMEEKLAQVKEAKAKGGKVDEETQAVIESLMKMRSETRKAIRSLNGLVSPKAKDVYKKIDEHLADKKNGKYIVFVQRKASANHIINNMPEHQKKQAVYYDASRKAELEDYLKNPNGPKILVAVDQSIKEGVNMQVANGMYRYDHHWSPGNQEQSYARIWRFGQDKPTKFHKGIVDGSIDVPKYARLMTKLTHNMQVVSDFESGTAPAFKMGLKTLREKNSADILPSYEEQNKEILDYQMKENKELQKRYGKGMFKKNTGKPVGGAKAQQMHGLGAYQEDIRGDRLKALPENEVDNLLGHFREKIAADFGQEAMHDQELYDDYFQDAYLLTLRQRARDPNAKKLDELTLKQYRAQHDEENDRPMSDKEVSMLSHVVNSTLSGKQNKAAEKYSLDTPLDIMAKKYPSKEKLTPAEKKEARKYAKQDLEMFLKLLDKEKEPLTHLGNGRVENPEIAANAFKQLEKKVGKIPDNGKRMLLGAAAMAQEVRGGWKTVKHEWTHLTDPFEAEEEEE